MRHEYLVKKRQTSEINENFKGVSWVRMARAAVTVNTSRQNKNRQAMYVTIVAV